MILNYLQGMIDSAFAYARDMTQMQFLLLTAIMLVVGFFCMRGNGERI